MADSELVSWVESERTRILEERKQDLAAKAKLKAEYISIWGILDDYKRELSEALIEAGIPWILCWDYAKMTEPSALLYLVCNGGLRSGGRILVGELSKTSGVVAFKGSTNTYSVSEDSAPRYLRIALGNILSRVIT